MRFNRKCCSLDAGSMENFLRKTLKLCDLSFEIRRIAADNICIFDENEQRKEEEEEKKFFFCSHLMLFLSMEWKNTKFIMINYEWPLPRQKFNFQMENYSHEYVQRQFAFEGFKNIFSFKSHIWWLNINCWIDIKYTNKRIHWTVRQSRNDCQTLQ